MTLLFKHRIILLSGLLLLLLLLPSCSKKDASSNLTLIVNSLTANPSSGLAKAALDSINGLTTAGGRGSFTPSSVVMHLKSVNIFSAWGQGVSGEIIGNGNEIYLNCEGSFDLVDSGAFTSLYSQALLIEKDKFGSYVGAKVLMSDTIWVSGTVTVDGKPHTITNQPIQISFSAQQYKFPVPLEISSSNTDLSIRLIFDVENLLYVNYQTYGYGTGAGIWIDTNLIVWSSAPSVIPYAGSGLPIVEQYRLTLTGDTTESIKMLILIDPGSGQPSAYTAHPVYYPGMPRAPYQGSDLRVLAPLITKTGTETYRLEGDPAFYPNGFGNSRTVFTGFSRSSHSGLFLYGNSGQYPYNAVLITN